jgi:uncharacterized damage-inducible protein DinB
MEIKEIKTIFDYNFWAFERVWECICQLSEDQFVEQIDYSTGSIRNIVVHMMSANRNWMGRLSDTDMPRLVYEEYISLSQTKAKWDEQRIEFMNYLYPLTQKQLNEIVDWELPARGLKCKNPRWEILLHLVNHGTDHRAQILALLHRHFHIDTIEQDMIFYLAGRNTNKLLS